MKQVIYETKGRAREFNELAINLFTGCGHKCIYCYGADVTHQDKKKFENEPRPRVSPWEIKASAQEQVEKGDRRRILLCFITDPYQPIENITKLTRAAIITLHDAGLGVIILTKGGKRSMRDFDILKPGLDAYATTLTLTQVSQSLYWEPGAANPMERIEALKQAHLRGIETWVSFEPVIFPQETFELLEMTRGFVDHWKIGTMNYHPQGKTIDWFKFGWMMKEIMDKQGLKYYFKRDLLLKMGILPANFKQTWVCK